MRGEEARELLGFPPEFRPNSSQIKAAYKQKALESHPDLFPAHEQSQAETKFKQISEAYSCLKNGERFASPAGGTYAHVVRKGFKTGYSRRNQGFKTGYSRWNHALIKTPFFFLIFATVSFGGFNAYRAYGREKEVCPSYNPFLP